MIQIRNKEKMEEPKQEWRERRTEVEEDIQPGWHQGWGLGARVEGQRRGGMNERWPGLMGCGLDSRREDEMVGQGRIGLCVLRT
jgi:hypothetical protein